MKQDSSRPTPTRIPTSVPPASKPPSTIPSVPNENAVAKNHIPGDANGDNRIDGVDYTIWLQHNGQITSKGSEYGDFNSDGRVDRADLNILLGAMEF